MEYSLVLSLLTGIAILLILILWVRIQAFLALLIASIATGLLAGMPTEDIILSIHAGMGSTLGFIATVVGLGAIFGALLEHSGGAISLASTIIRKAGDKGSSWALMLIGFIIAIPVFFDVALIILIPVLFSLQKKTGKSLLLYAIPLLAGLAVSHSFIPPTPGPVAVAEMLQVDLGKVILTGIVTGLPAAMIGGILYGKFISGKIKIASPEIDHTSATPASLPPFTLIFFIILLPILLIILNTIFNSDLFPQLFLPERLRSFLKFMGHPFTAMIIANCFAWYFLGIRRGFSREQLFKISTDSLAPAGIIILITGAGGVFKQILSDTGTGQMMADFLANSHLSPLFFAFLVAMIIRILQGSATVAMITSAGMTAALLGESSIGEWEKALLVIAIASGATMTSHVNDSGFWLVGKYLGLSEQQTLKTWTVSTTIIGLTGFLMVLLLSLIPL